MDSEYGPETEKAVKAFQKDNKLVEDGVFGSVSKNALCKKVHHLQATLMHLGYDLKLDGEYGPLTHDALKSFQRDNKLEPNGVCCEKNCETLCNVVKDLQTYLWRFGAYHGKVDGDLGYWTVQAIKTFQKHLRLKEDGIAGPVTWGKLKEVTIHLQWTLKSFGYEVSDKFDGKWNDKLEAALKKFQKDHQLVDDGIFGPVSYHKLHHRVKELQWTLTSMGIELGKPDGEFGPLTANGVKDYQKRHQLKVVDGIVGPETKASIEESVKGLQRRLKYVGTDVGNADGNLGPRTHNAILHFQKHQELKEDGICGMITWSALFRHIKHLQFTLKHLGFNCEVTGDADEKTLAATKEFQKSRNVVVDGVCGPLTHHELERATKRVQHQLVGVGFDLGKAGVDGKFGPFTENATKQFQKEVSLEENGVFCQKTSDKMVEWVKKIQTELTNKKYECGPVDGIFGYLTQSAVKSFQKDNSLVVDGVCGRVTRTKLLPK